MFFHKGKYYVAYGMHSSRTLSENKLYEKEMQEYYKEHGESMIVTYNDSKKADKYGSFGHCGHMGTSFFFNREKEMYVVILTNATRCSWTNHNFETENYPAICKMREDIHNTIVEDLELN